MFRRSIQQPLREPNCQSSLDLGLSCSSLSSARSLRSPTNTAPVPCGMKQTFLFVSYGTFAFTKPDLVWQPKHLRPRASPLRRKPNGCPARMTQFHRSHCNLNQALNRGRNAKMTRRQPAVIINVECVPHPLICHNRIGHDSIAF